MKVVVYHGGYGCDTGCCGHWVEIYPDEDMDKCYQRFNWEHPEKGTDFRAWARELAEEFIRDRFPDCLDTIDWDSMEVTAMDTSTC
jgi:hypothetical protein